jgi:hypothetical protein
MAPGYQASQTVDEAIDWTAMPGVFNLRDVFELTNHTLDDDPSLNKK